MNRDLIKNFVEESWNSSVIEEMKKFVEIPCLSPMFDSSWEKNGYIDSSVTLVKNWVERQNLENINIEVLKESGKTPVMLIDIKGEGDGTVLLYGHLDKQPESEGWDEDKGPYKPVVEDGKLYGRGSADDGYSVFTAVTAVKALQNQKIPHGRCLVMIETCEESGSIDLPYYLDKYKDKIGKPDLIICLDSGCGNYEQFWITTSLRGAMACELRVDILKEGIHSGNSGVIPSSFRVLRQLLSRVENEETGEILVDEMNTEIPEERLNQAMEAEKVLGYSLISSYPLFGDIKTISSKISELILQRTWRPSLSYIAQGGIPSINEAANLLRPSTSLVLSFRVPPTADLEKAAEKLKEIFESDPPYDAGVKFKVLKKGSGWNMPKMPEWLSKTVYDSSAYYFGKDPVFMGEGGSIPLMNLLSRKFPEANFIITGVLGPGSNAHGPNEFLHIDMAKKVTCMTAELIAAQNKKR